VAPPHLQGTPVRPQTYTTPWDATCQPVRFSQVNRGVDVRRVLSGGPIPLASDTGLVDSAGSGFVPAPRRGPSTCRSVPAAQPRDRRSSAVGVVVRWSSPPSHRLFVVTVQLAELAATTASHRHRRPQIGADHCQTRRAAQGRPAPRRVLRLRRSGRAAPSRAGLPTASAGWCRIRRAMCGWMQAHLFRQSCRSLGCVGRLSRSWGRRRSPH
jgi:hypothetical protein